MENLLPRQKPLKKYLPILGCIVLFALLSLAYFNPVLSGKVLIQGDIQQFAGSAQEILQYRAEHHGQDPYWTNSMFSGMPDYQITTDFHYNLIKYLDSALRFLPRPADYMFLYLLSFFVLMLVLRAGWKKALLGALMFGLTSYLFIILEAGHNSKAHAIAYLPLVVAGILLTYRGKYLWGGVLTAFAMGLEVYANHPQMTYYMGLALALYALIYLVVCLRKRQLLHFWKASGVIVVAVLLGIGLNAGRLWSTWSYQKHTIRGGSELTQASGEQQKGLDKDYLLMWSYGVGETFNLMIPNLYGGSSHTDLGRDSRFHQEIVRLTGDPSQADRMAAQAPAYWGDQPFTSGPAYVGAVVVFLFLLGCIIVRGPMKWWLIAATLISFLMAWGSNAMWFSDWMIDHFPLYNKFRTPSSALIVSSITMPILAVLAVREWLSASPSELPPLRRKRAWYATLGTTVGLCVLLILLSNAFFSFTSPSDSQTFGQYPNLLAALRDDRHSLLTGDAFRSAVLIALAGGALWLAYQKKIDANKTVAILSLLVLIDLWFVDKRYLNNDNFSNRFAMEDPFAGSAAHLASQQLAGDTSYFRVINLTVSPMQDASTSYYFHSVGGYHAAKLQRYQELWDRQIARGNFTILNMLNTKYFIGLSEDKRSVAIQENSLALGPAWVVDSLVWVPNADAEIAALDSLDLPRVAVADEKFAAAAAFTPFVRDSTHRYEVRLVSYQPNHLVYRTDLATPAPVIFSEIYYPDGWNAYIDGQPAKYFRANYVLRAMIAPQGEHTVEFRFEPREVIEGDRISLVCSLLLLGGTAGACWYTRRRNRLQTEKR